MADFEDNQVTFRFLAQPTEVNFGGKVHGGAVMKWIDQTAYTCAVKWSSKYCVTVYVGGIRFMKPILIGHMVEVMARVIYTGNSSMHIGVDILSIDPKVGKATKTTHCIIVFVAVDENGEKSRVPKWEPKTEEEKAWSAYALRLIDKRKDINNAMQEHLGNHFD